MPVLKIKDKTYKENFRDSKGSIVCTLDMTYPVFKSKDIPEVAKAVSAFFEELKENKISSLKTNLESLRETKQRFGIEGSTVTKITYEIMCNSEYAVSVCMHEQTGTNPDEDEGHSEGYSFTLYDGSRITFDDLKTDGYKKGEEKLIEEIHRQANISYSPNGADLDEDQMKTLDECYNPENFCCDNSAIYFLFPYKTLSGGSRSGTYFCKVYWNLVFDSLKSPKEYYEYLLYN